MNIANLVALTALLAGTVAIAAPPEAATQPDKSFFTYDRPKALAVEETTPTQPQMDPLRRPPQLAANSPAPAASDKPAKPMTLRGMEIVHLRFRDVSGEDVPVLLCKPAGKEGPFPVVIALHGLGSSKAQMCALVGLQLVKQGFAVLAPDSPLHGERPGVPTEQIINRTNWRQSIDEYRIAVIDVRQCIDLAEARHDLDISHGVMLVGYSMGAYIASIIGPVDDRVKAMCLMSGGSGEFPGAKMFPQLAAIDPELAITHFAGRSLLMLNGKDDPLIKPEMGRRLFAAAAEPKQQIWYDSGHILPTKASDDAATWMAKVWEGIKKNP